LKNIQSGDYFRFLVALKRRILQAEFVGVKGFSERSPHRMKLVYEELDNNSISPQSVAKLPWGHISFIISKIKIKAQREFYLQKAKDSACDCFKYY
jgi:hypothetical protein